ncbi:hypothetical protein YM304_05870 [Ilumatobacter coccineus YM16-304]|uniref:Uncharacterized protein n=1 Tax=Ilumatobacter coccineus (strain NBRC 103263 / KCTC 29153 / YM16-304) TaxID=1313172 RepID=A0A6C7E227_ILUCY|nr:hypothetical protein YM304_05870 [Ilumatobacter coccineus YM16-304]
MPLAHSRDRAESDSRMASVVVCAVAMARAVTAWLTETVAPDPGDVRPPPKTSVPDSHNGDDLMCTSHLDSSTHVRTIRRTSALSEPMPVMPVERERDATSQ